MDATLGPILVVEDDPASRKLIRAVLGARGYRIEEAEDLTRARALLEVATPALVLLDIRLGGSNGLELARHIRSTPRLAHLPIIAITAQALKDDESRILGAGCDAYLAKPIDTRRLPQLVADHVQQQADGPRHER